MWHLETVFIIKMRDHNFIRVRGKKNQRMYDKVIRQCTKWKHKYEIKQHYHGIDGAR